MSETSILRIAKFTVVGLLLFVTACSPLVVVEQPGSPVPSPTALPTNVSAPTLEPTTIPTESSSPVTTECQDSAQYISDDGLDGTAYAPNTPFTKIWTVKNTGSCTWNDSYMVSQISGTNMTQQPGYWIVPQGQTVAPDQTVNINIGMTSPIENGNYRSAWGLKNENGQFMPIKGGANGNSFYVRIRVNDGSAAAGKVTAASIAIELEQGSDMVCTADATYFVHAYISADGPTTVSYEFESIADNLPAGNFQNLNDIELSRSITGTVIFDQAGTKTINLRFVGPYPYPEDITIMFRVNNGEWTNVKLHCL